MALKRKQNEEDDAGGAAEWMVTFSDCMTLLLTFFVLLISFSSFDEKVFQRMESALAEGLGSVSISLKRQRDGLETRPQIVYEKELDRSKRKLIGFEIQKLISDNLPVTFTVVPDRVYAIRNKYRNFNPTVRFYPIIWPMMEYMYEVE